MIRSCVHAGAGCAADQFDPEFLKNDYLSGLVRLVDAFDGGLYAIELVWHCGSWMFAMGGILWMETGGVEKFWGSSATSGAVNAASFGTVLEVPEEVLADCGILRAVGLEVHWAVMAYQTPIINSRCGERS